MLHHPNGVNVCRLCDSDSGLVTSQARLFNPERHTEMKKEKSVFLNGGTQNNETQ